jgi:hypothetical protein
LLESLKLAPFYGVPGTPRRLEMRVKNEPDLAEKVETLKEKLEIAIFQA